MALTFYGGIPRKHRGSTFGEHFVNVNEPETLVYKINKGFSPCVAVGDDVCVNTPVLTDDDEFCVYSSVSGKVIGVDEKSIEIANDKNYSEIPLFDEITSSVFELDREEIIKCIKKCGIVDGKTGVPLYKTLANCYEKSKRLVVNCVESEPLFGAVRTFIKNNAKDLILGINLLMYISGINKAVIAFSKSDTNFASKVSKHIKQKGMIVGAFADDKYPQGDGRLLVTSLYDLEVGLSATPEECGYLVLAADTVYNVYNCLKNRCAVKTKALTAVDGKKLTARNVEALCGTKFKDIQVACGFNTDLPVYNGGIIGGRLDVDGCVTQTTQGITVDRKTPSEQYDCIRCGDCVKACPMRLLPYKLYEYICNGNVDDAASCGLYNCMECGACSYVCPSKINLRGTFINVISGDIPVSDAVAVEKEETEIPESDNVEISLDISIAVRPDEQITEEKFTAESDSDVKIEAPSVDAEDSVNESKESELDECAELTENDADVEVAVEEVQPNVSSDETQIFSFDIDLSGDDISKPQSIDVMPKKKKRKNSNAVKDINEYFSQETENEAKGGH